MDLELSFCCSRTLQVQIFILNSNVSTFLNLMINTESTSKQIDTWSRRTESELVIWNFLNRLSNVSNISLLSFKLISKRYPKEISVWFFFLSLFWPLLRENVLVFLFYLLFLHFDSLMQIFAVNIFNFYILSLYIIFIKIYFYLDYCRSTSAPLLPYLYLTCFIK